MDKLNLRQAGEMQVQKQAALLLPLLVIMLLRMALSLKLTRLVSFPLKKKKSNSVIMFINIQTAKDLAVKEDPVI